MAACMIVPFRKQMQAQFANKKRYAVYEKLLYSPSARLILQFMQ